MLLKNECIIVVVYQYNNNTHERLKISANGQLK